LEEAEGAIDVLRKIGLVILEGGLKSDAFQQHYSARFYLKVLKASWREAFV